MSLNKKVLLLVFFIFSFALVGIVLASNYLFIKGFANVEKDRTETNVVRAINALDDRVESIEILATDWGRWDDSYEFALNQNEEFIETNTSSATFEGTKLNLIAFIDPQGKLIFGKAYDLEQKEEIKFPSTFLEHLQKYNHAENIDPHTSKGIMIIPEGPLLLASHPILNSEGQGPPRGTIFMGTFLTKREIVNLSRTAQTKVNFFRVTESDEHFARLVNSANKKSILIETHGENVIHGLALIKDIHGQPALTVEIEMDRDIYQQGLKTVRSFYLFLVGIAVFSVICSLVFLRRFVLFPVAKMVKDINRISSNADFSSRLSLRSNDEWGMLAQDTNKMLDVLESLQQHTELNQDLLEEKVQEIAKKNQTLEETKLAMLNLLEDEKKLEEDLRQEKEGVEKKVEERTKQLKEARDKISQAWFELRQEKARLSASINSLSLGFILTDTQNNIITMNPAVGDIFGFSKKLPKTIAELSLYCQGACDLLTQSQNCLKGKKAVEVKEVPHGDRYFRIFMEPILVSEDKTIGLVILIEDITEAKALERTREEFFSLASHELRTPLTAIRGNTSLIQDYLSDKIKGNKDLEEMINDIHESSVRLIKIVNDFLDASRLEQKRITFKNEALDLGALVKDIVQEFEAAAIKRGLEISSKINKGLPEVLADKDRVKQVVFNLIDNALKYTPKGKVEVSVTKDKDYLKVQVKDSGAGISKENQKLLFHKFQQAGERILTRDVTQGTGMGLYISKLMVEGMGGKIYLEESQSGKGSIFTFTLPIVKKRA